MTDRELMQQALEALELLAKYENPLTKIQVRKPRNGGPIVTVYPHKVATEAAAPLRERLAQPEQELVMKRIKTWSERCEEHPDHQQGMISEGMIRARMQEEIDELRQALETEQEPVAWASSLDFDDDDQEIIPAKDKGKLGTSNCDIQIGRAHV